MADPAQAPPDAAPQDAQAGGQGDPMQAIQQLGQSLQGLAQAMQQAGAPKEVLGPLQDAINSFGEFTDALQGKGTQQMPMNAMNEGGNPNAAPANY